MLGELVPKVLFDSDRCCFDVFAVSVDYVVCCCESYCVGTVAMVMSPLPTTVPWVQGPPSSH